MARDAIFTAKLLYRREPNVASALAAALPSGPLPMTAMGKWAAICTGSARRSAQCRQDSARDYFIFFGPAGLVERKMWEEG